MPSLILDIRLEQNETPIGYLVSAQDESTSFSYSDAYLAEQNKIPVSLSLPLRSEPFGDVETRAFFENLLPENDQLQQVVDREGLSRSDVVGLLFHLGSDCPGAISCVPENSPPVKVPGLLATDYDVLDDKLLTEIVRRLADREPLPDQVQDPSPIAGVQRKIAVAQMAGGEFAIPKPGLRVPTTHILKVPRRIHMREARLETIAAELAAALSFDVAIPQPLRIGEIEAILVKRFDRDVRPDGVVTRIHQEDFAQALGLPAGLKYERHGRQGRRFDASSIAGILNKTLEPAASIRNFLLATIFNLAVGNSDNHAKNHALLYDAGPVPRMAPLYDLLPVALNSAVTHDLSFKIGNAKNSEMLTKEDFDSFLSEFGLSSSAAQRLKSESIKSLLVEMEKLTGNLKKEGLKDLDDLIGGEIKRLSELFGLSLDIRNRDYFAAKGGGWQLNS